MAESIYLYYSNNDFLLNHAVEDKIKELNVDPFNIVKYDLLENPFDDVLEDLQTVSFFAEKKVIVIRNIQELEKADEYLLQSYLNYLGKPNPDVVVIIVMNELLPESSVLGTALFKYSFIEKVKDMDKKEYPDFIRNMFKKYNYTITDDAIEALLERTNLDFNLINQEAEKLMLFAYETKEITERAVLLLVSRNLEENIFELTNALLSKNQSKTIEIFYDLVARNEDPLRILNNIVAKVRELMHAKLLLDKGYRQDQIAEHFHIKSGRAYYLVKNAQAIPFAQLENHLKKLSKLDYDIKSGKIDKKLGLELYLLGA
ncbi:MAG: DNA polymerase III subunit delta [Acholeplasmataceae bacterium]|jgi:DNA polymerase-3 subunit delta|nr:DNA polymerase III subunit delta [Acholeplasmataceae bacterium]